MAGSRRRRALPPLLALLWSADPAVVAPIAADPVRGGSLSDQAARFHTLNPGVYDAAVQIARQLQRAGCARYSIGGVWELLRFQGIMTRGDRYRLNNNFRAWYARRIMACEPELVGFFEVRGGGADHE